jgi:hypothetical protein
MSPEMLRKGSVSMPDRGLATITGVGVLALMLTQPASATQLTWNLQDVRFDDGGVALGRFIWETDNPEGSQLISATITTTDGRTVPGFAYDTNAGGIASRSGFNFLSLESRTLESETHSLAFVFNSPPTSSEFDPNFILRGQETFTSQGSTVIRAPLELGYVTAVLEPVPIPGTLTVAAVVGGIVLKRKLKQK